jgi:hypothetical protein
MELFLTVSDGMHNNAVTLSFGRSVFLLKYNCLLHALALSGHV